MTFIMLLRIVILAFIAIAVVVSIYIYVEVTAPIDPYEAALEAAKRAHPTYRDRSAERSIYPLRCDHGISINDLCEACDS